MGEFMHDVEGEMMCTSTNEKIPYFNAPIYLENKTPVGKVDEILGPITQVYFTIKPTEGIQAKSFKKGDKFFIGGDKLLPLDKYVTFLPFLSGSLPNIRCYAFNPPCQIWPHATLLRACETTQNHRASQRNIMTRC